MLCKYFCGKQDWLTCKDICILVPLEENIVIYRYAQYHTKTSWKQNMKTWDRDLNFQNSIWTNFPTIFFIRNDTYIQIASGHDCGSVLPLNITCNLTLISQALWDVFTKRVTIFVWRLDRKAENWPSQLYLLGQTSKRSNSHIELQFQLRPPLFCLVCIHFNSRNNF